MKLTFISAMLASLLIWKPTVEKESFEPYTETIPNTKHKFEMVCIPAGKFLMGSPANEANRNEDEGPQKQVELDAFWMAPYELTWDLFLVYQNRELEIDPQKAVDAVSRPTKPYVEMSFGQGKNGGFPVCNVTQYSARSFCKWLYLKTGHFYRLPTEAEWEYAAKAGSKTAWSFGDEAGQLGEYAWFFENSDGAYKKVGQKKPNAWGLYDMYGNVAEWTSDQYTADLFKNLKDGEKFSLKQPKTLYPITIKGGHWDSDPQETRSAARWPSSAKLKQRDPQIPKSDWWLTDAPFVGFRLVRPLHEPSKSEIEAYFAPPPKDK
ncbi:formylglycine-generating enzyme family protein [Marinilongibacter aquaticus]|uniref:formylglycine-generating enzyme family protein n=1 Tax=Marinilongibacter aquaticus TaxID=2975157 RepID=UPI0021BD73C6|nr:SUMF1/EgtB/PvdO family nonheme iron enzyme [Marinilongibacter aquaticus]UBM59274.1 formylglycine-generating enzyme family protein [Marinilongibacter aquaticus]